MGVTRVGVTRMWVMGGGGNRDGDRGGCLNHMQSEAPCKYVLCGSNEEATGSESLLVLD